MGVGRPALSNFLNGKASLSREMAGRLQATFNLDPDDLMKRQQAFVGSDSVAVAVVGVAYAPSLFAVRAEQIERWVDGTPMAARSSLAALIRVLVNSTARDLKIADFPAFENAERPGWDGRVDAGSATPWVPAGVSCWELGSGADPTSKADDDFEARTRAVPEDDRKQSTFVFVTPRNWKKKRAWEEKKRKLGAWREVRALDASDLEQWIEQSTAGQVWFAERNGMPRAGVRTLEDCWRSWSEATEPRLVRELLTPALAGARDTFRSWLTAAPSKPLVVAADSRAEALAFIDCLFRDEASGAPRLGDNVLVADNIEAVRKLATASPGSITLVANTMEVERELAALHKTFHCIAVRPRNVVDAEPDIALDLLSHSGFKAALEKMELNEERIDRLSAETGRSPTILRRRLATSGAVRVPMWGRDAEQARKIVVAALLGAWHVASKGDCEIVSFLSAGRDTEADMAALRLLDDAPVWSIGNYRGVSSKIDALFAVAPYVVRRDLEDFLFIAECVLSERDPALDLPEDRRWYAGLYGKVRAHSGAINKGIAETLVLLAVHGHELFFDRLGFDVAGAIAALVRRLLEPVSLDRILSQTSNLPLFAEAAPEDFLGIIERDLRNEGVVLGLLKPADSGLFGSGCPRSGLLWALETLAWREDLLPRVVDILGRLSLMAITDNWMNKPENSLRSILRSWLPQTSAKVDVRIAMLERLVEKFPSVAWGLCIAELEGHQTGEFSHRPNWRNDASGAGRGVPGKERRTFVLKAVEIALSWRDHDEHTLGDLVEHLQSLSPVHQEAVWTLIEQWASDATDEIKKATLRERIRRYAFTRRSKARGITAENATLARRALQTLAPSDPVIRHAWLFKQQWVEDSIEEYDDEKYDYRAREERIRHQRVEAIREIWSSGGEAAIDRAVTASGASWLIGESLAEIIDDGSVVERLIERFIRAAQGDSKNAYESALRGLIWKKCGSAADMCDRIQQSTGDDGLLAFLLCLPFAGPTWRVLDEKAERLKGAYWSKVWPRNLFDDARDMNEAVDRLIAAQRPLEAFHCVHLDWEKVETGRLKDLLRAVAGAPKAEPAFRLSQHDIGEAFKSLDGRADVSKDELASLEFRFLQALDHSEYGIPNLERQIAESPALFIQAVALAFRRKDGGKDPDEISIVDASHREAAATTAYRLLDRVRRCPGSRDDGTIDLGRLKGWLQTVRGELKTLGRSEIGDQQIGQLLARAAKRGGGVWPPAEICEAIEWIGSHEVAIGFNVAERNSRGVHTRGEGGDQERNIAARYRASAQALAYKYPFVRAMIDEIATSYERQAQWEDTDARVRSRLP